MVDQQREAGRNKLQNLILEFYIFLACLIPVALGAWAAGAEPSFLRFGILVELWEYINT